MTRKVAVKVSPRIHLGLLSMHRDAPRLNGGVGFAIESPQARIDVVSASQIKVIDERSKPMGDCELAQLQAATESFAVSKKFDELAEIRISGEMLTHVGFGSATAIRLAALEALSALNGSPVDRTELILASARGGASGIGINTYFQGGLVCELGRRNEGQPILPSSRINAPSLPLSLPSVGMPDWPMLICTPRAITPKTQLEEVEFFRRTAPLADCASFEATYLALFTIYACAAEADYRGFCQGVERMQLTTWKSAERREYGEAFAQISAALLKAGADCAGMSSLGPLIFCFAPKSKLYMIANVAEAMDCDVHRTSPRNLGRQLCKRDA